MGGREASQRWRQSVGTAATWARAGGMGRDGVALGGPRHSVGPKRLVGLFSAEGRNATSTEEFKRKLSWAAKAIGPNSRMGCKNSF
jgi:hypothetical protein